MVSKTSLANLRNFAQNKPQVAKTYLCNQVKAILARYEVDLEDLAKILNVDGNALKKRLNTNYSLQGAGSVISLLELVGSVKTSEVESYKQDSKAINSKIVEYISEDLIEVHTRLYDFCTSVYCLNPISDPIAYCCDRCKRELSYSIAFKRYENEKLVDVDKRFIVDDRKIVQKKFYKIYLSLSDSKVLLDDKEEKTLNNLRDRATRWYIKQYPLKTSSIENLKRLSEMYHSTAFKNLVSSETSSEELAEIKAKAERIREMKDIIDYFSKLKTMSSIELNWNERVESIKDLSEDLKSSLWEVVINDYMQDRKAILWMKGQKPDGFYAESSVYEMVKDGNGDLMVSFDKKGNPHSVSVFSRKLFSEEEIEANKSLEKQNLINSFADPIPFSRDQVKIERAYNEVDYIMRGDSMYLAEINYYAFLYYSDYCNTYNAKYAEEIEAGTLKPMLIKLIHSKGKANLGKEAHESLYELLARNNLTPLDSQRKKAIERIWLIKTNVPFKELERYPLSRVISQRFYKRKFVGYEGLSPRFEWVKNELSISDRETSPLFECSANFELSKACIADIDVQGEVQALYRDVQALNSKAVRSDRKVFDDMSKNIAQRQNALRYSSYFRPRLHIFDMKIKFQKDDLVRAMNKYYNSINRSVQFSFRDSGMSLNGKSHIDSEQKEFNLDKEIKKLLKYARDLKKYFRYNDDTKRFYMHHSVSYKTLIDNALEASKDIPELASEREHLEIAEGITLKDQNGRVYNVAEDVLFNIYMSIGDRSGIKPIYSVKQLPISDLDSSDYFKKIGDYTVYSKKQVVAAKKMKAAIAKAEIYEKYGDLLPFNKSFYPKLSGGAFSDILCVFGKERIADHGIVPIIIDDISEYLALHEDQYLELHRDRDMLRSDLHDIIDLMHYTNEEEAARDHRKLFAAIPRIVNY